MNPVVVVVVVVQNDLTVVDVLAEVHDVFESQGDEAREEEGAEGVHVELDEAFGNRGSGGACGVIVANEGVGGGDDAEEEG